MTHLVGQQLGRYTIQEEIGRGGMARVYRAFDTLLKRTVALKVLAPQLAVDPEFAQRFEREAVTAANLRHPNIVTIYDVGEHNSLRYIAMEYVRGRTLHAIIEERGALGLGFAIGIVAPVAAALDYAHSQGAVHRDIKPQNIMIDFDGRVLLTDFGIAQAPEGRDGERLTRTGIFMGTPEYISPEQASAQRVDGRSDLYSLGIATYEVITGSVPFSGATPQLIVAHAQKTPPPPSSIDPAQPPELDLVMARILAKRPEQRFASGAGLVEGLRTVARKHGVAAATPRQLAALISPRGSPASESTVSLGRGSTPPAVRAPLVDSPPAAPRPGSSDPTQVGPTPPRPVEPARPAAPPAGASQAPTMPSRARALAPPPRDIDLDEFRDDRDAPPAMQHPIAMPAPPDDRGGANRVTWVIAGLFGGLSLVVLFVILRGSLWGGPTMVTPTGLPVATIVPTQVTKTPTPLPTATLTPTPTVEPIVATAVPEQPPPRPRASEPPALVEPSPEPPAPVEPSPEPPTPTTAPPTEPPTPTTAPPTETPTVVVTSTKSPPRPPTATSPPGPATATSPPGPATATSPPGPATTPTTTTSSPSPGATAAATVSPESATAASATATATPVPATATATPVPATATATPVPATATGTEIPTTATPAPTATPLP